ncbi:MAG: glycogen synthase [Rhodospirillales bacterium]|nr:glycogen synthase [Rhodospirillales bacterium]
MRILFMTNEYPPHIYGGAGVHVEYLSKELARVAPIEIRSFHDQSLADGNLTVRGTKVDGTHFSGCPVPFISPLRALSTCLAFNGQGISADIVHCHTWYAHFGGVLAKLLYGLPLVITVHSLEPLRPWKREQIGRGYELSCWVEKTALEMADAVIAVSKSTGDDLVRLFDVDPARMHVIANGIDTDEYKPVNRPDVLARFGIDYGAPYVLFVGRMTRQKGLLYLLQAIDRIDPQVQVVLCAGESDTKELQAELEAMVDDLRQRRPGVIWIPGMLDRPSTIALYSHASVFCCPSIYEPFGIINLEAMACGTPVVGSGVGGIPEVVVDGETGFIVKVALSDVPPHDPDDPVAFSRGLADGINRLALDPALARQMGEAGRARVIDVYSWRSIAKQTLDLYKTLIEQPG